MKLTGQALKDFEKWYNFTKDDEGFWLHQSVTMAFTDLPPSMQWGVYLEWFDSVGILVETQLYYRYKSKVCFWDWVITLSSTKDIGTNKEYDTRQEAQTAAIEKANEIYNSK